MVEAKVSITKQRSRDATYAVEVGSCIGAKAGDWSESEKSQLIKEAAVLFKAVAKHLAGEMSESPEEVLTELCDRSQRLLSQQGY